MQRVILQRTQKQKGLGPFSLLFQSCITGITLNMRTMSTPPHEQLKAGRKLQIRSQCPIFCSKPNRARSKFCLSEDNLQMFLVACVSAPHYIDNCLEELSYPSQPERTLKTFETLIKTPPLRSYCLCYETTFDGT